MLYKRLRNRQCQRMAAGCCRLHIIADYGYSPRSMTTATKTATITTTTKKLYNFTVVRTWKTTFQLFRFEMRVCAFRVLYVHVCVLVCIKSNNRTIASIQYLNIAVFEPTDSVKDARRIFYGCSFYDWYFSVSVCEILLNSFLWYTHLMRQSGRETEREKEQSGRRRWHSKWTKLC